MPQSVIISGLFLFLRLNLVRAKLGYGSSEQDWGFIDVREGAHMFYWLYYTTANVTHYTERPLVVWLQGGPGSSATGHGNFLQLGPLDPYGNPRNQTWVKHVNVLFIDSPVGSGFSFVDNISYLTSNNNEIAKDLVALMKGFFELHSEFEVVPLHIFCVSYGGKMGSEFAFELYNAIQMGDVRCNLKSTTMGNPWISPIDSMKAWAPLLVQIGIIDHVGFENIQKSVKATEDLVNAKNWTEATLQWSRTQRVVVLESRGIDFFNFERPTTAKKYKKLMGTNNSIEILYRLLVNFDLDDDLVESLTEFMRGPVSDKIGIPSYVKWGSQSGFLFSNLIGDFMTPVVDIVSKLLDETDLKVGVMSGQLDLFCATAGAVEWINKMEWHLKNEYLRAPRLSISVNDTLEGYDKSAEHFSFYIIYRAGHIVPTENPSAMSYILRKITNYG